MGIRWLSSGDPLLEKAQKTSPANSGSTLESLVHSWKLQKAYGKHFLPDSYAEPGLMRAFGGQKAQMCHSQRFPRAKEPLRDPCLKRGICMNFSAGPCTRFNTTPAKLLLRFHSEAPHRHSARPLNSGGSSLTKRLRFQKVLHVLKCKCSISRTTSTSLIFASGSSPLYSLRGLLQSSYSVPDPLLAPAVTAQPRHRSSPQGHGHWGATDL